MSRKKSNTLLWNIIAVILLIVSIVGIYIVSEIRVVQGYFTADPFVIVLNYIFDGLLYATLIGWIVGNIIARTKK